MVLPKESGDYREDSFDEAPTDLAAGAPIDIC